MKKNSSNGGEVDIEIELRIRGSIARRLHPTGSLRLRLARLALGAVSLALLFEGADNCARSEAYLCLISHRSRPDARAHGPPHQRSSRR